MSGVIIVPRGDILTEYWFNDEINQLAYSRTGIFIITVHVRIAKESDDI
jgi:hypothetical protein